MKSAEYERVTRQISEAISATVEGELPKDVKHGGRNKWEGASGYKHQIDVTVRGAEDLIFIECKSWNKPIKAEQVLTFAGRICDVQKKLGNEIRVHPILVTTVGFQRGCKTLADYFRVELSAVQSAQQFVIRYKHLWAVGLTDSFHLKDKADIYLKPES